MAFGFRRLSSLSAVVALAIGASMGDFVRATVPSSAPDELRNLLIPNPDDEEQLKIYGVISGRPMTDNDGTSRLQPTLIFELARRLFAEDREAALDWAAVAGLRIGYDIARCRGPSLIQNGPLSAARQRPKSPLAEYNEHPQAVLNALQRVLGRGDLFTSVPPTWICGRTRQGDPESNVKPRSEWPAIEKTVRQIAAMSLEQQRRPLQTAPPVRKPPPPLVQPPDAIVHGTRADKIRAIGAEARASAMNMAQAERRPARLIEIAELQIDAGNADGGRETLAQARLLVSIPKDLLDWHRFDLLDWHRFEKAVELLVRAGDPAGAQEWAGMISDSTRRLDLLGTYGAALAKSGDITAARGVLELVEHASVPAASEADGRPSSARPVAPRVVFASVQNVALRQIGSALLDRGDVGGALDTASHMPVAAGRSSLLAEIAHAQCAIGDKGAGDTLRMSKEASREVGPDDRFVAAMDLAYAFASCNDVTAGLAAARELIPGEWPDVLARVAQRLSDEGDNIHARELDDANADELTGTDDLVGLAGRQLARNRPRQSKLDQGFQAGSRGDCRCDRPLRAAMANLRGATPDFPNRSCTDQSRRLCGCHRFGADV